MGESGEDSGDGGDKGQHSGVVGKKMQVAQEGRLDLQALKGGGNVGSCEGEGRCGIEAVKNAGQGDEGDGEVHSCCMKVDAIHGQYQCSMGEHKSYPDIVTGFKALRCLRDGYGSCCERFQKSQGGEIRVGTVGSSVFVPAETKCLGKHHLAYVPTKTSIPTRFLTLPYRGLGIRCCPSDCSTGGR